MFNEYLNKTGVAVIASSINEKANWPIIQDTRSSAVAAITATAPFATLEDGQRITLHIKKDMANSSTLNLTLSGGGTTGAKSMVSTHQSTSASTTWNTIKANSYIDLVYESANNRWVLIGQRDTNNTYTVNNATLTIQKEGTTVKTFTANASSNVTCNIVETDPIFGASAAAGITSTNITNWNNAKNTAKLNQISSSNMALPLIVAPSGTGDDSVSELNYVPGVSYNPSNSTLNLTNPDGQITFGSSDDNPTINGTTYSGRALGTETLFASAADGLQDGAAKIGFYDENNSQVTTVHNALMDLADHTHTNESMGQGYGITSTSGTDETKAVTLTSYELKTGGIVSIYFTNAHKAPSLSLNINQKGTKPVYYNESMANIGTGVINAGDIATFMYDGSHYRLLGVNSGFHNGYGSCSTAAGTTTKTASIANYKLKSGGIVSVRFQYAVPASAALNINDTGAKPIYYNNAAITANVIKAGDTATFMYDGTYYRLISIDKTAPLASPTFTGTPTAPTATAGTNTTQIATTAFVTTAISNASSALKYTIKNPSSNAVAFSTSSSSKMQPNTVYIVGSGSGASFAWSKINTLSIPSGSLDGDLGVLWQTGNNSQLPNSNSAPQVTTGMTVGTYQILWIAGTNGTSITLSSSVKWKNGIAPDPRDMANRLCELTIMNGLATINIS